MLRPGPDRGENGIYLLCARRKPQRCRSRDQRADLRRPGWLGCPAERRTRPGMLRNPMKSWPAGRCGGAKSMPRETRGRAWECLGDAWGTGRERHGGADFSFEALFKAPNEALNKASNEGPRRAHPGRTSSVRNPSRLCRRVRASRCDPIAPRIEPQGPSGGDLRHF